VIFPSQLCALDPSREVGRLEELCGREGGSHSLGFAGEGEIKMVDWICCWGRSLGIGRLSVWTMDKRYRPPCGLILNLGVDLY